MKIKFQVEKEFCVFQWFFMCSWSLEGNRHSNILQHGFVYGFRWDGFPEVTARHEGLQSHRYRSDHLHAERSVEAEASQFRRNIRTRLTWRNIAVKSHFELVL